MLACFSTIFIFPIMVHLDTNCSTCWPQQSNIMVLRHLATQPCWPHIMVHLDTNDSTRWLQQSNIMALRHLATQLWWSHLSCHPISSNSTSWCCNQSIHFTYDLVLLHYITTQASIGNVSCVCLCKCNNVYNIHPIVITISPHQAYINISRQQFNIYIIHHIVTR